MGNFLDQLLFIHLTISILFYLNRVCCFFFIIWADFNYVFRILLWNLNHFIVNIFNLNHLVLNIEDKLLICMLFCYTILNQGFSYRINYCKIHLSVNWMKMNAESVVIRLKSCKLLREKCIYFLINLLGEYFIK